MSTQNTWFGPKHLGDSVEKGGKYTGITLEPKMITGSFGTFGWADGPATPDAGNVLEGIAYGSGNIRVSVVQLGPMKFAVTECVRGGDKGAYEVRKKVGEYDTSGEAHSIAKRHYGTLTGTTRPPKAHGPNPSLFQLAGAKHAGRRAGEGLTTVNREPGNKTGTTIKPGADVASGNVEDLTDAKGAGRRDSTMENPTTGTIRRSNWIGGGLLGHSAVRKAEEGEAPSDPFEPVAKAEGVARGGKYMKRVAAGTDAKTGKTKYRYIYTDKSKGAVPGLHHFEEVHKKSKGYDFNVPDHDRAKLMSELHLGMTTGGHEDMEKQYNKIGRELAGSGDKEGAALATTAAGVHGYHASSLRRLADPEEHKIGGGYYDKSTGLKQGIKISNIKELTGRHRSQTEGHTGAAVVHEKQFTKNIASMHRNQAGLHKERGDRMEAQGTVARKAKGLGLTHDNLHVVHHPGHEAYGSKATFNKHTEGWSDKDHEQAEQLHTTRFDRADRAAVKAEDATEYSGKEKKRVEESLASGQKWIKDNPGHEQIANVKSMNESNKRRLGQQAEVHGMLEKDATRTRAIADPHKNAIELHRTARGVSETKKSWFGGGLLGDDTPVLKALGGRGGRVKPGTEHIDKNGNMTAQYESAMNKVLDHHHEVAGKELTKNLTGDHEGSMRPHFDKYHREMANHAEQHLDSGDSAEAAKVHGTMKDLHKKHGAVLRKKADNTSHEGEKDVLYARADKHDAIADMHHSIGAHHTTVNVKAKKAAAARPKPFNAKGRYNDEKHENATINALQDYKDAGKQIGGMSRETEEKNKAKSDKIQELSDSIKNKHFTEMSPDEHDKLAEHHGAAAEKLKPKGAADHPQYNHHKSAARLHDGLAEIKRKEAASRERPRSK